MHDENFDGKMNLKSEENNKFNSNGPNDKDANFYYNIDESQKREINKLRRSAFSSHLLNFTEGLSSIASLAISYYFKNTLKVSPARSSFFQSLISLPYIFQPLFGLISDIYPIMGYKRRTYLMISGLISCFTWISLSIVTTSQNLAVNILILNSLSETFIYACSRGILVEISKKRTLNNKKLERYNTSAVYRNIGMLLSSLLRGVIIEYFSLSSIFIMAAFISFLYVISGFIYYENSLDEYQSVSTVSNENNMSDYNNINNFYDLMSILNTKKIIIPLLYILVLTGTPSYFETAFYYLTDLKGFSPISFGNLTISLMIYFLLTSILYKKYIKDFNRKFIIFWACIISFLSSCLFNVWITFNYESKFFIFNCISSYVSVKSISSRPIMDLAFLICPQGYEGSVIGLFDSACSLGKTISTVFGSLLAYFFGVENNKYTNFNIMVFTNNLICLLPLLGLVIIDDDIICPSDKVENQKSKNYLKNNDEKSSESTSLKEKNML